MVKLWIYLVHKYSFSYTLLVKFLSQLITLDHAFLQGPHLTAHIGSKWLKPAKKIYPQWFHEFSNQVSAYSLDFRFRSLHVLCFKMCQNVAVISTTTQYHKFFNLFFGGFLSYETSVPRNRVFALSSLILTYWDNCDSSVTKLTGLYSIFWHELFCMLVSVSQKYWCIWQLQRKSLTKCKRVKIKKKKSTFLTGGS